ncbi:unnamed protein product [Lactuca saligna]|uniref:Uncharacterized protein n=1 Tax=Lactuca saligna TaxID=75948 RepID=A0AA35Z704_LACSI|nr:unnamed protein product [Lactuca saligna]
MHEPIVIIFSSQYTEAEKVVHNVKPNDDDVMVSFVDLQFDYEEENIPDDLIMSGKQFKILNSKINSLLQIQADTGGKYFVAEFEMEYLMKAPETRLRNLIEGIE